MCACVCMCVCVVCVCVCVCVCVSVCEGEVANAGDASFSVTPDWYLTCSGMVFMQRDHSLLNLTLSRGNSAILHRSCY